jgi:hypothetical protein
VDYNRREELEKTLREWTDMSDDAVMRVTWAIVELVQQMIDESKEPTTRP